MTEWPQLLSTIRPHDPKNPGAEPQRTAFQRDFDRIVFSSSFRRLQDKTQVHPLPNSDYIRRRLTHSLEVSCVARSLGTSVGHVIKQKYPKEFHATDEIAAHVGQVTAAAALVHDIGNPPFGHVGEEAIGSWFKLNPDNTLFRQLSADEQSDLRKFEGNAQGFRILVRLANNRAGLKLTAATLGAFTKYPTASGNVAHIPGYVGEKKHGFFLAEAEQFAELARTLGLRKRHETAWQRHPLAFLVEAADDICYRIIDLEDGVKLGRIHFTEAEACLVPMIPKNVKYCRDVGNEDADLGWLRAQAIGGLIEAAQAVFVENEEGIRLGKFATPLLDHISAIGALNAAKEIVQKKIFDWDRTIKAEIAGAKMLHGLLGDLVEAASDPNSQINKKLLQMVPFYASEGTAYANILTITDYISGMTDSYLVQTHRQVHGYALN